MSDQEDERTNLEVEVDEVVEALLAKGDAFVQLLKERLQETAPKRRRIRTTQPNGQRRRRAI